MRRFRGRRLSRGSIVRRTTPPPTPGALGGARPTETVASPVAWYRIAQKFAHVVLTQDRHTLGHISFASAHPGKAPFEVIKLPHFDAAEWPPSTASFGQSRAANI